MDSEVTHMIVDTVILFNAFLPHRLICNIQNLHKQNSIWQNTAAKLDWINIMHNLYNVAEK